MIKKIIFVTAILCIGIYVYLDISTYYPEKFKIKSVKMTVFNVGDRDKLTGCLVLNKTNEIRDTNSLYILGLRYDIEYISEKHEHIFFNLPNGPHGAFGHSDTIINMDIFINANRSIKESLKDANEYKIFTTTDSISLPHHGVSVPTSGTCFEALSYKSVQDFISEYNSNKVENMMFSKMKDYHFYLIPRELLTLIKSKKITLKIETIKGSQLTDTIRIN